VHFNRIQAAEERGPSNLTDSIFRLLSHFGIVLDCAMPAPAAKRTGVTSVDEERMREVYRFTAGTLETRDPKPFGALIVNTKTGERLMRATNAVMRENDPSSHAEVRTVRLACKKLKRPSLAGYTMYSTCEPCPMCMANALWAKLDRVVFGATIADANKHCLQVHIAAKEVARRSDMACVVDGPVLRELCYSLFTHPNMLKAFRTWSSRKP
jgi:tRNA(Arg) A34 adenosine deaminase TadA